MMSEIMIPVDPKCIPDGYEAVGLRIARAGEDIARSHSGRNPWPAFLMSDSEFPELVIRKKYNPGIGCIPEGWWVWQQLDAKKSWVATPSEGGDGDDVAIYGLQNLLGFNPPPDGQPRQIA
jgi:hypothetical protein